MLTQLKFSNQSNLRTYLDIFMIVLGILLGGVITLIGLWLWLDYRANPGDSLLAALSGSLITLLPVPVQDLVGYEAHVMGLPLAGETRAYWYMARAGGIVAYILLWLSVGWGLTLSTKVTDGLVPAPIAYGLHEFLSIGVVIFAGLHTLVLLGDSYIHFHLAHLVIPFIAPYQPFWTGLGTLGFYLAVAMTGSFYIRKRIGQKVWRTLHYLTFATYALALVHGLMAGSDSNLGLVKLMYLATGFSVLFLTYYRLFTLKVSNAKPARR